MNGLKLHPKTGLPLKTLENVRTVLDEWPPTSGAGGEGVKIDKERLEALQRQAGLSGQALAARAGITPPMLSRLKSRRELFQDHCQKAGRRPGLWVYSPGAAHRQALRFAHAGGVPSGLSAGGPGHHAL